MELSIDQSIQDIVQIRRDLRIQRIDAILKEFDTLEVMIDSNESYVNLCYKYEQIFSLWIYIHRDFQPDELTNEETTIWRLMPAILLCYKHCLIKKRESMDKDGVNMDDRPIHELRSLPKSRKSNSTFVCRVIFKVLHLKKRNSSAESETLLEKIKISIKFKNKLKKLSEDEIKQEWKHLVKQFRKATAQCYSSDSSRLVSNNSSITKQKWIKQVEQLVNEIEQPSIIDDDIKNHADDSEHSQTIEENF